MINKKISSLFLVVFTSLFLTFNSIAITTTFNFMQTEKVIEVTENGYIITTDSLKDGYHWALEISSNENRSKKHKYKIGDTVRIWYNVGEDGVIFKHIVK